MPVGDIKISTLKIGDIDLLDYSQASFAGFNIYEDILNPTGPMCDIRVIDHSDILGKKNLNGSYDKNIEIKFSLAEGDNKEEVSIKLKMLQNKNLDDKSGEKQGSGHSKQYDIRGVSSEFLNAQGNYVQKGYNGTTASMVEDMLKNNFKTDKKIDLQETTKGKRRLLFNNEHPLQAMKKLNGEHVSSDNESSCFVCFQRKDSYVFATFEHLFKQEPVVKLSQNFTLDYGSATNEDKQNSIRNLKISDSFFTATRPLSTSSEQTINLTTHGVVQTKPKSTTFQTADGKGKTVYKDKTSYSKEVPVQRMLDKANDKNKHETTTAAKKRSEFLSHLVQNSAELVVPGNPKIKLGSMIELNIPKKANSENAAGEKQFNGKALVVAIRHKIAPLGVSPRYTMVLRVVKASFKEGSGGEA